MKKIVLRLLFLALASGLANTFAFASTVPNVAVSIKPLHAWVSAVMEGVGKPDLIVKGTGSEHGYTLKPSDAAMLAAANIVFFDSNKMETFLVKPLQNLAPKAKIVALSEAPGVKLLPVREGGMFERHGHGGAEEPKGAHHDEHDLHFWLDPQNAIAATNYIAKVLSEQDPDHAAIYNANAAKYDVTLNNLIVELKQKLAPYHDLHFIVFHDAYHYFERRFGLQAMGSVTVDPEHQPGAQRVANIHQKIINLKAVCVFSEPQFEPALVSVVVEGTKARRGVLDPLGVTIAAGKDAYPELLNSISNSLIDCAKS